MPPKYKPGGRKFPPKISSPASTASTSNSSQNVSDSEIEDKFEIELYWCIQQLQTALNSGKMNERQILETNKTLNVLTSSTAPLIKKRQFMRTTFGDYRAKMSQDEKKLGKNSSQVKFSGSNNPKTNSSVCNRKSIFLKKATAAASSTNTNNDHIESASENNITENTTNFRIIPTGNSFSFNFKDPEVL